MNWSPPKFRVVLSIGIGLLFFACNSAPSNSGNNPPDNYYAPTDSKVQSSVSGNEGNYFQLPSSPDVPPSDVIEQITWGGQGGQGGGSSCDSYCVALDTNLIHLNNFQPNQRVEIDLYKDIPNNTAEFFTEISVQTDNEGNFDIHLNSSLENFRFVVRDGNGNVMILSSGLTIQTPITSPFTCPGQINSRLSIGMNARVTYSDGTPLRIHSKPSLDLNTYIADLDEGTTMTISDGPICVDDIVWWQVNTKNGYSGWVAEGDQSSWFVEPIK